MKDLLYYLNHYFRYENALPFFLVSLLGMVLILGLILLLARLRGALDRREEDALEQQRRELEAAGETCVIYGRSRGRDLRPVQFVESFFEMVFASTSVLLILSLYYIINDRISGAVSRLWGSYKDWMLILFLLISMLVNRVFDRILVPLRHLTPEKRASIRLISALYIVLILLYIRFIYNDYNYENLILYFMTLVIGRFVYFDVTWEGFCRDMRGILENLPFLLLMGIYSGSVIWYGFHSGFLWKSNGVIVSTLIAHLFMDTAILLIEKSRILRLLMDV